MGKKYHLFEVYGIELEYMLVSTDTFKVTPIVDLLLTKKNGSLTSDIESFRINYLNHSLGHLFSILKHAQPIHYSRQFFRFQ